MKSTKAVIVTILCCLLLTACGDKKPTEDEVFQLAKNEISMALCGDKSASCFIVQGGNAKISDKKTDGTYSASATFRSITGKTSPLNYSSGTASFDIDAKTGDVYIKTIDAWSEDGKKTITLCGRDYQFCKK